MIIGTVYLRDHINTVRSACIQRDQYSIDLIDKAIVAQVENNLHYRDGKVYDKLFGLSSEYLDEAPVYKSEQECAEWEFCGYICNSAWRLQNGYPALFKKK
jgi:hypothetical protein